MSGSVEMGKCGSGGVAIQQGSGSIQQGSGSVQVGTGAIQTSPPAKKPAAQQAPAEEFSKGPNLREFFKKFGVNLP